MTFGLFKKDVLFKRYGFDVAWRFVGGFKRG